MAMSRQRQPLAVALSEAKRQLGRRVYFEARVVAEVIDHGLAITASQRGFVADSDTTGSRPAFSP